MSGTKRGARPSEGLDDDDVFDEFHVDDPTQGNPFGFLLGEPNPIAWSHLERKRGKTDRISLKSVEVLVGLVHGAAFILNTSTRKLVRRVIMAPPSEDVDGLRAHSKTPKAKRARDKKHKERTLWRWAPNSETVIADNISRDDRMRISISDDGLHIAVIHTQPRVNAVTLAYRSIMAPEGHVLDVSPERLNLKKDTEDDPDLAITHVAVGPDSVLLVYDRHIVVVIYPSLVTPVDGEYSNTHILQRSEYVVDVSIGSVAAIVTTRDKTYIYDLMETCRYPSVFLFSEDIPVAKLVEDIEGREDGAADEELRDGVEIMSDMARRLDIETADAQRKAGIPVEERALIAPPLPAIEDKTCDATHIIRKTTMCGAVHGEEHHDDKAYRDEDPRVDMDWQWKDHHPITLPEGMTPATALDGDLTLVYKTWLVAIRTTGGGRNYKLFISCMGDLDVVWRRISGIDLLEREANASKMEVDEEEEEDTDEVRMEEEKRDLSDDDPLMVELGESKTTPIIPHRSVRFGCDAWGAPVAYALQDGILVVLFMRSTTPTLAIVPLHEPDNMVSFQLPNVMQGGRDVPARQNAYVTFIHPSIILAKAPGDTEIRVVRRCALAD